MSIWAVVVPTNRPERLPEFLKEWKFLISKHDVEIIVVRDLPPWKDIPWFIPRRSDMIRSWGFYLAWKKGVRYILSLDDDVAPVLDVFYEYERAFARCWPLTSYLSVGALTDSGEEMRGFPYFGRDVRVGVQYGGWIGVPDYDAMTQIRGAPHERDFVKTVFPVPRGCPVTTCAMNFAFRADLTPIMWQLPLRDGRYNRFGDIWSGLFQKRTLDVLGQVMLVNGRASVAHDRASDPWANIVREAPGLGPNEGLWGALDADVSNADVHDVYREVTDSAARYFDGFDSSYARYFKECRDRWLDLF